MFSGAGAGCKEKIPGAASKQDGSETLVVCINVQSTPHQYCSSPFLFLLARATYTRRQGVPENKYSKKGNGR